LSKHIWIINEYAGSPKHGMEFRHYYLAKELVGRGHKVTIVSSSYSHLFANLPSKPCETIDGIDYLFIKSLNYGMAHDKKRVLKWLLFMIKVLFLRVKIAKADVIMVSSPSPFPIVPAWIIAKLSKAKLLYEVRDIWPLSLIELGGFKATHPFMRLMAWFESFALKHSDEIISNLPNYKAHLSELGIERTAHWISNGVNLEELSVQEPLENAYLELLPKDKFIVGYTGTIGLSNAMDSFLQSAKELEAFEDIVLVIVGEGQLKADFMKQYKNSHNILFLPLVKKAQVGSVLALFDVCFIGWLDEKLYRFGTSANKVFDYMYSAKPILHAFSGGGDVVKIANCGVSVKAGDKNAIAYGVKKLYAMSKGERANLGTNGKKYVIEHFSYKELALKLEKLF